jgi:hypothetical protein
MICCWICGGNDGTLADKAQSLQVQQLAEQQFQSSLAAWSAYLLSVNARPPQTVRMQANCNSVRCSGAARYPARAEPVATQLAG